MPRLPPHVFDDLMARFGNRFFAADLRRMRGCEVARPERSKLCYGEVPSLWMLDAMQELTRVIMADRQIRDYVSSREYLGIGQPRRVRLLPGYAMTVLQLGQRPWRVPTDDELDKIAKRLPTPGRAKNNKRRLRATWSQVVGQYQFSAAAVAIDFLESMPVATRRHLRHIILHENRLSVANPECHARGLVPFCDENPALRIDRRVSLWRNCFLQGRHGDLVDHARQTWRLNAPKPVNQLHADQAARPVAQWICEASLLPKQITLIFDCDGTPERTSQVFQEVIQRDAAWQTALDRAFGFPDGSTSPDKFDTPAHIRCIPAYHCEGFPELLRAICDKDPSSRVRCDGFDPGRPWEEEDIQAIIEANRDRTPEEWGIAWERPRVGYKTAPPLPDFRTLLDEEVRR
ncbi:hypothetical protein QBC34DRAFT_411523 [Podospora aff. communis PSN243]|uniref:Uncharacterized protein n=1 Tax=Podospora aff. communis PSN243 TaxID=3040156 RepID=A0AAV9GDQ2_9PEZI|nr:hypothetical protein QBC34DRAFT_411523 [Podospora aff. communis PSN243]